MKLALGKRGKLLLAGAVLLAIAVAASFVRPGPELPSVRINGYTIMRIRTGMTREEVEAIFHVPAGEYSSLVDPDNLDMPTTSGHRSSLQWDIWGGDNGVLFVHFGADGKADDWELRLRHNAPKQSRVDYWLDVIKYKWLGW